ncbi:hypothetical protein [Limnobacter thiooxidans]
MKIGLSLCDRSASTNASGGESSYSASRPMEAIKQILRCIANTLKQAFNTSRVDSGSKSAPALVDEEPWNPQEARYDLDCLKIPKSRIAPKAESTPHPSSRAVCPRPLPKPVELQQLNMPANPEDNFPNVFPFGVNYNLAKVPVASRLGISIETDQALRSELRNSILSRQGIFEWARQGGKGLRSQLESGLIASQSVSLGHGVVVHGLEGLKTRNGVQHYQILVSAPAQDVEGEVDTFVVPVTELQVPNGKVIEKDWLRRSARALQFHLSKVDPPYQDSVETPLVLSSGCNRLADLHVLQTEVSSRIQAGLVQSQNELTQTLRQLAPEFLPNNSGEAPWQLGPVLQRQLIIRQSNEGEIQQGPLASKRHFVRGTEPTPLPDASQVSATAPAAAPTILLDPEPEPVFVRVPPVSNLDSPRELTLVGKAPPYRPIEGRAFRQIGHDNHCGIAAINGFFQTPVISPAKAVNHILDHDESFSSVRNLAQSRLPGLYHPNLVAAIREGKGIVMRRNDFVDVNNQLDNYEDHQVLFENTSPAEQWDSVCNYKYPGLPKPDEVEITPDLWLSVAKGMHVDRLESMVNQFLRTKGNSRDWSAYPDRVTRYSVGDGYADNRAELEESIKDLIQKREGDQAGNTRFPMICMISGHYFAVARAENGDWVKLDSNGTNFTGIQPSSRFAKKEELEQALIGAGVIHVICEPLPLPKQPDSEAERR